MFNPACATSVTLATSRAPVAIYANSAEISTWSYQNGVLSITADPSTITIFFNAISTPPVTNTNTILLVILLAIIVVVAAAGAILAVRRR